MLLLKQTWNPANPDYFAFIFSGNIQFEIKTLGYTRLKLGQLELQARVSANVLQY